VIPKAPIQAQILIGLFAVLAIAYGASIIRLADASHGSRSAVPGQLIVVRMNGSWGSLTSSNTSVLKPISITLSPTATGYFIALLPGRSTLSALSNPCPTDAVPRCMLPARIWQVEVKVWPSG
jgi:hypothetical protein